MLLETVIFNFVAYNVIVIEQQMYKKIQYLQFIITNAVFIRRLKTEKNIYKLIIIDFLIVKNLNKELLILFFLLNFFCFSSEFSCVLSAFLLHFKRILCASKAHFYCILSAFYVRLKRILSVLFWHKSAFF